MRVLGLGVDNLPHGIRQQLLEAMLQQVLLRQVYALALPILLLRRRGLHGRGGRKAQAETLAGATAKLARNRHVLKDATGGIQGNGNMSNSLENFHPPEAAAAFVPWNRKVIGAMRRQA
jgi:hypothetical protein